MLLSLHSRRWMMRLRRQRREDLDLGIHSRVCLAEEINFNATRNKEFKKKFILMNHICKRYMLLLILRVLYFAQWSFLTNQQQSSLQTLLYSSLFITFIFDTPTHFSSSEKNSYLPLSQYFYTNFQYFYEVLPNLLSEIIRAKLKWRLCCCRIQIKLVLSHLTYLVFGHSCLLWQTISQVVQLSSLDLSLALEDKILLQDLDILDKRTIEGNFPIHRLSKNNISQINT